MYNRRQLEAVPPHCHIDSFTYDTIVVTSGLRCYWDERVESVLLLWGVFV